MSIGCLFDYRPDNGLLGMMKTLQGSVEELQGMTIGISAHLGYLSAAVTALINSNSHRSAVDVELKRHMEDMQALREEWDEKQAGIRVLEKEIAPELKRLQRGMITGDMYEGVGTLPVAKMKLSQMKQTLLHGMITLGHTGFSGSEEMKGSEHMFILYLECVVRSDIVKKAFDEMLLIFEAFELGRQKQWYEKDVDFGDKRKLKAHFARLFLEVCTVLYMCLSVRRQVYVFLCV